MSCHVEALRTYRLLHIQNFSELWTLCQKSIFVHFHYFTHFLLQICNSRDAMQCGATNGQSARCSWNNKTTNYSFWACLSPSCLSSSFTLTSFHSHHLFKFLHNWHLACLFLNSILILRIEKMSQEEKERSVEKENIWNERNISSHHFAFIKKREKQADEAEINADITFN